MSGFKTVTFGVLLALTSILSNADMAAFVAAHLPTVGGSVGMMVIILRALTNSSIFTKNQ